MKKVIISTLIIISAGILLVSCKKESANPPAPIPTVVLIASTVDPYSGPMIVGGAGYYLIQKKVPESNQADMHTIYTNRRNGGPYSDEGKIYYDPSSQQITVKFGANVIANVAEFRASVNTKIEQEGYAIVSNFLDGGPDYEKWKLMN